MTWTGQLFSVGQILTAAQMTNLQADITAFANQDSGAPAPGTNFITLASQLAANVVGASEIAPSAVGTSEIAASAVGTSEIAVNGVRFNNEIALGTAASSDAVGNGTWTVPRGVYAIYGTTTSTGPILQANINSGWRDGTVLSNVAVVVVSDGSNVRVNGRHANDVIYYDEIFD